MDIILHWLQSNQALDWIGTGLLAIVGSGLAKYAKDLRKDLRVATHCLELVQDLLDACDDNKISPEEVEKLRVDIQNIKEDAK
jgi:hypothetical protein